SVRRDSGTTALRKVHGRYGQWWRPAHRNLAPRHARYEGSCCAVCCCAVDVIWRGWVPTRDGYLVASTRWTSLGQGRPSCSTYGLSAAPTSTTRALTRCSRAAAS